MQLQLWSFDGLGEKRARTLGCGEALFFAAVPFIIVGVDDVSWWISDLGMREWRSFDENWGMEGGVGYHDWRRRRLFAWWFDG